MKKKISYLLLVLISVLGSKIIFGKDYHLNSDNLISNNLYEYKIFDQNKVLSYFVSGEELYYVLELNNSNYSIIKYNLTSNRKDQEYKFSDSALSGVKLFKSGKYIYLTSLYNNLYLKLNNDLELVSHNTAISNNYDTFGMYNDPIITTLDNEIYLNNELIDSIPVSCGKNREIIYDKNTYLHFHNSSTGFGCLYNVDNKNIEYLDYEKIDITNNRFLEYQDNRLSFKYDSSIYYFNDITESNYLEMHSNGDYLFTINSTKKDLKIYNLETRKIIFERNLDILENVNIDNVLIDDYVFFTVNKDNENILYIWDYLKENRVNKDMIYYNEMEYKFKNNELKEEIKDKYNIDVYIYDQAVQYFEGIYVIPSYDDILINYRLNILKDILSKLPIDSELTNIVICFDKELINNNAVNPTSFAYQQGSSTIIAFNITSDSFQNDLIYELGRIYPSLLDLEIGD